MSTATRVVQALRGRLLWLIPIGVCILLIAPMAFTERTFAPDWIDHVWLAWQQEINIRDLGLPSYFTQTAELGAFYPFFAFYGANLYSIAGFLSVLLGPVDAVVALYFVAFLTAYCGWTWLSMQAGLRGLSAYLPGCIAVTAAYAVTVAYGRGDFAETVATSTIPLVVASGLSIVRSNVLKAGPVAAFVLSIGMLTGSHSLTLLWATTFLVGAITIAALSWPGLVRAKARRVCELAALSLLGIGISLWFLIPLALHSGDTVIGERGEATTQAKFTTIEQLFSPFRSTTQIPNGAADIQAQLPVLGLVCAALLLVLAWSSLSRGRRSLTLGLAGLLGLIVLLVTIPSLFDHLPRYWRFTQFPYRLITYGNILVVGLLVLGLAGLATRPRALRRATIAVAAIAAIGTAQATVQAFGVPSWLSATDRTTPHSRDVAFPAPHRTPLAWYASVDFGDASEPTAQPTLPQPLEVPVSAPRRRSYEVTYPPGPAGRVETNVTAGPYLVAVDGAELVGTTSYQHMVLRLDASRSPRKVTFSAKESAPLVAGQVISLLSLLGTVALVVWLAIRGRREGGPA